MSRGPHVLVVAAAVAMLVAAAGCAPLLSRVISTAPNELRPCPPSPVTGPVVRSALGFDAQFAVEVGPPMATLSVSVIEPCGYQPPRATVLVLHGIWASSFWMRNIAGQLADNGYRAVLVDFRGHGRSSGGGLTFGVRESQDVSQVIDELQRRNLAEGPLGIFGISYGAATSLHVAGNDCRVQAVVAVAPFSTMRDAIPDFFDTLLPGMGRLVPDETYQQAIDQAGLFSLFDPDAARAVDAIRSVKVPTLIIHGMNDRLVPADHGLRLRAANRDLTKLVLVPRSGHVKIWLDADGVVAKETIDWFGRTLSTPVQQESTRCISRGR